MYVVFYLFLHTFLLDIKLKALQVSESRADARLATAQANFEKQKKALNVKAAHDRFVLDKALSTEVYKLDSCRKAVAAFTQARKARQHEAEVRAEEENLHNLPQFAVDWSPPEKKMKVEEEEQQAAEIPKAADNVTADDADVIAEDAEVKADVAE